MVILIALMLGIVVVVAIAIARNAASTETTTAESVKPSESKPTQGVEMEFIAKPLTPEEPTEKFHCYIAGLGFRENSAGAGVGISLPEPDNPHDKNAITIRTHRGKLIGYVPKKAHSEYFKFFPDKANCFVIYNVYEEQDELDGEAFFIRIHSWQYVWREVNDLIKWYKKKRGVDVLFPENLREMLENNAKAEKEAESETELKE